MTVYRDHIGIDVSKDHLDIFSIAENKAWRIANEPGAIRDFPRRRSRESLIVFEATSVYDRTLRGVPARARRVFARVNPRRAHAFARATGLLAKTDRVDARMLAQLGAALNPTPTREPPAERQRLAAPPQRRNQLVEMRKQEKTRRKQVEPGLARRDIDSLIRLLTRRVDTFDRAIKTLIRASAAPAPFSPASPRSLTTPANERDTAKIKGGGPRIGRASPSPPDAPPASSPSTTSSETRDANPRPPSSPSPESASSPSTPWSAMTPNSNQPQLDNNTVAGSPLRAVRGDSLGGVRRGARLRTA